MRAANLTIQTVSDPSRWDPEVHALGGHPLQLWAWGEVKGAGAWTPHRLHVTTADGELVGLAQVLVRSLPAQFKALSYVPRGPVVRGDADGTTDDATRSAVTTAVVDWCRANVGGVGITLEPDWDAGVGLDLPGSAPTVNPILYPVTLILDLRQSPDELLADMAKTRRYDIRRAARNEMDVRRVTDEATVREVLDVYKETAARAGFGIHGDEYYLDIHRHFGEQSVLVAAFDEGRPTSFVWCVASATTSFELYGGSNDAGRKQGANAATMWHSIELAREAGVVRFDMNGLLNDGISEFKRSFSKHENELIGSIDVPFSMWYGAWNKGLPTAKKVVRRLRGGR